MVWKLLPNLLHHRLLVFSNLASARSNCRNSACDPFPRRVLRSFFEDSSKMPGRILSIEKVTLSDADESSCVTLLCYCTKAIFHIHRCETRIMQKTPVAFHSYVRVSSFSFVVISSGTSLPPSRYCGTSKIESEFLAVLELDEIADVTCVEMLARRQFHHIQ